MDNKAYFVTGTDTGVGKTISSIALIHAFQDSGMTACGIKPVASGGRIDPVQGLVSDDALLLMENSTTLRPYNDINPICLKSPCSPNIAAELEGIQPNPEKVSDALISMREHVDCIIVEGVGGWRTPCFGSSGLVDVVSSLNLPVILVVGVRLGCINHALLTAEAIIRDGLHLCGWIANEVDPKYNFTSHTIEFLQEEFKIPLLGKIPYLRNINKRKLGNFIDHLP
jgi:dethiobiotin synthetase